MCFMLMGIRSCKSTPEKVPPLQNGDSTATSPAPQEVLPEEYGRFDFVAPPKKSDINDPDGWTDEIDVGCKREKQADGTFKYVHPEWRGSYGVKWGRYDRDIPVEGMADGNTSDRFVIPAEPSKPVNLVKFRSLDPAKGVRMWCVWAKLSTAK